MIEGDAFVAQIQMKRKIFGLFEFNLRLKSIGFSELGLQRPAS